MPNTVRVGEGVPQAARLHAEALWGLHNYVEANRFKMTRLRELLRATARRRGLADGDRRPRAPRQQQHDRHPRGRRATPARSRASSSIASLPRNPRIKAVYLYHWNAAPPKRRRGTPASSPPAGASAARCSCCAACCGSGCARASFRAPRARRADGAVAAAGRPALVAWLVLAAAALVALAGGRAELLGVLRRRLLAQRAPAARGQALYRDFAGAQPPPLYLLGAARWR